MSDSARTHDARGTSAPHRRGGFLVGERWSRPRPGLALAALLLGSASCGDGATTEPDLPLAFPPRVSVSPETVALSAIGATARLSAQVFDQNGGAMTGETVSWASSDDAVASVDGSGLVTATGNGSATITATARTASGTATVTVTDATAADRAVLVALYEATNGPGWVNSDGWLTDARLGEWYGVGVDAEGRVAGLDLSGRWDSQSRQEIPHGLEGPIPPQLGDLSNLTVLNLERNALTGPIPSELGNLSRLEHLVLSENALTGPIPPQLGNLSRLEHLVLGGNALTGQIPPQLGNLSSLTWLYLSFNALTGQIPSELGNLSRLEWLFLNDNSLTGSIPRELGNLSNLKDLFLRFNALTGSIPRELGSLSGLDNLYLNDNSLTGPIPPELGNLSGLERLRLNSNSLTGPIPESFLGIRGLRYFYIAENQSLCVPNTAAFLAWLQSIENRDARSVVCASG